MSKVILGIVLTGIGIAVTSIGFKQASSNAEDVMRNGATMPGEIVAIDGTDVEIEFSLARTLSRATAHPTDADSYDVGQFVTVSVLRDRPSRIVIHDSTETPSLAGPGLLILGAITTVAGVGMVLIHLVATPGAGVFPRFGWSRERHGGA